MMQEQNRKYSSVLPCFILSLYRVIAQETPPAQHLLCFFFLTSKLCTLSTIYTAQYSYAVTHMTSYHPDFSKHTGSLK